MKRFRRILAWLLVIVAVLATSAFLILRSDWFLNNIRQRIIAELEKATGGRAEIGAIGLEWPVIKAKASGVVLHGSEPAGHPPLLRIENLEAGLAITSFWNRDVSLRSLVVRHPEVHLLVNEDGSSNIPEPGRKRDSGGSWSEDLLRLKAGHFEISDGVIEYNDRKIPFSVLAEKLNAAMDYESTGPHYRGAVKAASVRIEAPGFGPLSPALDAAFTIAATDIHFSRLKLDTRFSHLELPGVLTNLNHPRGEFDMKGTVSIADLPKLPVTAGTAIVDGKFRVNFSTPFDYGFKGTALAKGLAYRDARIHFEGASANTEVDFAPDKLTLTKLRAHVLGANFVGGFEIEKWAAMKLDGKLSDAHARTILTALAVRELPWDGIAAGTLHVEGTSQNSQMRNVKVAADMTITPAAGTQPLTGRLDIHYSQSDNSLRLGESFVATPATRIDASGTLGEQLVIKAQSTDLRDLKPLLQLLDPNSSAEIPIELHGGGVRVEGALNGAIENPHFVGSVQATQFRVEGHDIDKVSADVDLTKSLVKFANASATHALVSATGSGQIALHDWKLEDGAISGQVQVRGAQLAKLAKEFGQTPPVEGVASAALQLSGTAQHPAIGFAAQSDKIVAYGETLTSIRINGKLTDAALEIASMQANTGGASLQASGRFDHPTGDYRNGTFKADASTGAVSLSAIQNFREANTDLDGKLQAKLNAAGRVVKGELELTALNGDGTIRALTYESRRAGDLVFSALTQGGKLTANAAIDMHGEKIDASAEFPLSGDYTGSAQIRFPKLTVATLHDLRPTLGGWDQLPFDGYVSGTATVTGSLKKLNALQAEVNIKEVQVSPKASQKLRLGVQAQDVVLKNAKPFKIVLNREHAIVSDAEFSAQNTRFSAGGKITFDGKTESELLLDGNINLAILQLVNSDLLAKGDATLRGSIRGSLANPQIRGRLELKNASLYLADLPNGVDNANGALTFDNGRATIDKLTAESGGGQIKFNGFVEYGGAALVYRLQAQADSVRVRYPEDLSITFNSQLSLSGSSDNSLLSGNVSVNKMSFQPKTDLGQLVAASSKPVPTVSTPNEYLRGMQFDVHIESGPEMQVNTSLSSNVQAEIDLRLRGSPIRPALLGTVSVDSGDIQVFGNKYAINRGEVRFFNPVKIEPNFDMDLETKARGITVNISFSGTLNKLNVTYRSDPPLQTREIIALLAVGRDPNSTSPTGSDTTSAQAGFAQAGNSLLGQALNAQLSNRVQRFFGVSRVKIDPQLTGVEALPQARLTLEQQVSRDITVTYITNLNRTQEQIVRVQWDISKEWSAVALRDGNGVFGIDLQFRKRFK